MRTRTVSAWGWAWGLGSLTGPSPSSDQRGSPKTHLHPTLQGSWVTDKDPEEAKAQLPSVTAKDVHLVTGGVKASATGTGSPEEKGGLRDSVAIKVLALLPAKPGLDSGHPIGFPKSKE